MRRQLALGVAIATLTLVAGCSGDEPEATIESATGEASEDAESAAPDETEDDAEDEAEDEAAAGAGTTLIGRVGTEEDPDAFEITLTDEAGEPVTELPAGDYIVEVSDPSAMHNFHLTGGTVDETTSVPEVVDTTFEVTLEAGEYTYKCDPHPPMTGSFTVT